MPPRGLQGDPSLQGAWELSQDSQPALPGAGTFLESLLCRPRLLLPLVEVRTALRDLPLFSNRVIDCRLGCRLPHGVPFALQIPRVDGEYDLKVPRDMAYVFSGAYVPLSCRVIEQVRASAPRSRACPALCSLQSPACRRL